MKSVLGNRNTTPTCFSAYFVNIKHKSYNVFVLTPKQGITPSPHAVYRLWEARARSSTRRVPVAALGAAQTGAAAGAGSSSASQDWASEVLYPTGSRSRLLYHRNSKQSLCDPAGPRDIELDRGSDSRGKRSDVDAFPLPPQQHSPEPSTTDAPSGPQPLFIHTSHQEEKHTELK